jgi:pilus assembly protein CpaF
MLPPPAALEAANDAGQGGMTAPTVLAPALRLQGALSILMERLATHMNVARSEESAFPAEHQATLDRLLDQLETEGVLGPDIDRKFLREAAVSEAVGLGPLDRLLASRAVREIIVDGPARVLADLGSGLAPVSAFFSDDSAVLVVARRLLHRAGQRLDGDDCVHDAILPGGGSVQLLMPPLSPKGPLISVRCPARAHVTAESLVSDAMVSSDMLALLRGAVQQRRSLLVFGPDGAGVSTMLGVLAGFASEHERIVAIEDTPGASLHNPQLLPLSRRALPEADLAQLLHRASQLRADRLLIDDLRPQEALSALSTAAGTSGVLFGMHAPSPELALALLEQFAQAGLPSHTRVRGPLMAAAIQVLVHIAPDAGHVRRVRSVTELQLDAAQMIELKTLYRHDGKAFIASFLGD